MIESPILRKISLQKYLKEFRTINNLVEITKKEIHINITSVK